MNPGNQVVQALQTLLYKKDFVSLQKLLVPLLQRQPGNQLLLRFRAASSFSTGNYESAITDILVCLKHTPEDNELKLNAAKCFAYAGDAVKAREFCDKASNSDRPECIPALIFYFEKLSKQACSASLNLMTKRALNHINASEKLALALLNTLIDVEDITLANRLWPRIKKRFCTNENANDFILIEAQLNRANGHHQSAIKSYHHLLNKVGQNFAIHHNLANCLWDVNDTTAAISHYVQAHKLKPDFLPTIKNLVELWYESGQSALCFDLFNRLADKQQLGDEVLDFYITFLIKVKQHTKLWSVLDYYNEAIVPHKLAFYKSEAFRIQGKTERAGDVARQAVSRRLSCDERCQLAQTLLVSHQYELATTCIETVLNEERQNQWALSLTRYCGSEFSPGQNSDIQETDYIFEEFIQPPASYTSLHRYLSDVAEYLDELHVGDDSPLFQTLHRGTQTKGNLFSHRHVLLTHLQAELTRIANNALNHYKTIPNPYSGFADGANAAVNTAWSVNLKTEGFHNDHIHPMGWLSSVVYIALPSLDNDKHEGWLRFGQTNFIRSKNTVFHNVMPEEGKLIIFPSYFWHGTYPFNHEGRRLTVACDFVPEEAVTAV